MGLDIDRETFDAADEERFARRLRADLAALDELLARPGFGDGPATMGVELELSLVDEAGGPLGANREVLAEAGADNLALELNRFNVEMNSTPVPITGRPFRALGDELTSTLDTVARAAAPHGGRPAVIGILPTLGERDLQSDALTDLPRFRALSARIRGFRQAPFRIRIDGRESLSVLCDDVTVEGANTSFQVHLRVPLHRFAATYNAAQIATGPVLAACGNSPILLDRLLWDETRVALFRQAVDERESAAAWRPARVGFGHGWVRNGPLELFAESVALHQPLLPVCGTEDPMRLVRDGALPQLDELRLHNGTVWRWNRPVYDPADGGHVRIEFRALPAGPTIRDMMANCALLLGLTLGLADHAEWMTAALPFRYAERNFYAAARRGLDAMMLWPEHRAPSPRPVSVTELLDATLPIAARGLDEAGVDADEADELLGVVADRIVTGVTGAVWQRRRVEAQEGRRGRHEAVREMFAAYRERSAAGAPVHTWDPGAGRPAA